MSLLQDRLSLTTNGTALAITAVVILLLLPRVDLAPKQPPVEQDVSITLFEPPAEPTPPAPPQPEQSVPTPEQPPPPVQQEAPPPETPPPPPDTPPPDVTPPEPPPPVTEAPPLLPAAPPPPPAPRPVARPAPRPAPAQPAAPAPPRAAPAPATTSAAPAAPAAPSSAAIEDGYVGVLRRYYNSINKYPDSKEARMLKPHGDVVVRFVLDRAGTVIEATIERPSAVMMLNQQALMTVRGGHPPRMPDTAWPGSAQHVFTVTLPFEAAQ